MDNVFKKFTEEIKFEVTKSFEQTRIIEAKLEGGSIFHLQFHIDSIIPFNEMQQFLVCLNKNFKYKSEFQFSTTALVFKREDIMDYLK